MFAGGKAAVIAEEMRRYGISLLGLGDTRWLQSGQVKLASGESIHYSGHPDDSAPHTEGVAFMLSKEAQRWVQLGTHQLTDHHCQIPNHPQENKPPSGTMLRSHQRH